MRDTSMNHLPPKCEAQRSARRKRSAHRRTAADRAQSCGTLIRADVRSTQPAPTVAASARWLRPRLFLERGDFKDHRHGPVPEPQLRTAAVLRRVAERCA
jgi:hypothetical protein